jgi:electron transfer flavoprotein beta subunit
MICTMKILLPFKSVPDPETSFSSKSGIPSSEASLSVVNPFDAIAIEEALRMKERGEEVETVCVTIGQENCVEQIRTALGMGVDRAILIQDHRNLDPYAVARILQAVVLRECPSLVLMGKQAIDNDLNQTGQMLAGLLGWPQATFVSGIEFTHGGGCARCTRETDEGSEVIQVTLPAVVTTDLRLNEPRYVSLPGLMRAKKKAVEKISLEDLQVKIQPRTVLVKTVSTPPRPAGIRVGSVDELIAKLKDEGKFFPSSHR